MSVKTSIIARSLSIILLLAVFVLSGFVIINKADEENWSIIPLHLSEADQNPSMREIPEKPEPLTIIFGGDVMLSRTVNAKINSYGDYAWPFQKIASTTAAADIAVVNLESPFLKDADYRVLTGSFSFRADPKALEGISLAGIDMVSLANNHILNAGKKGLSDTTSLLDEAGIAWSGAGLNEMEARRPAIIERKGKRIAFLAYAYPNDNSVATVSRLGTANLDKAKMEEDVRAAKGLADIVIVQMHAGTEYVVEPGKEQKDFARAAISAGADAVIGHHPHWPQSWEIFEGKPIFYSLGNFIFDQMWSTETSRGLLASLSFAADGSGKARLLPILIDDYGQAKPWPSEKPLSEFWSLYGLSDPGEISWPGISGN
ncbi:MAG: CapA family protein [Bacillota bacterium]